MEMEGGLSFSLSPQRFSFDLLTIEVVLTLTSSPYEFSLVLSETAVRSPRGAEIPGIKLRGFQRNACVKNLSFDV